MLKHIPKIGVHKPGRREQTASWQQHKSAPVIMLNINHVALSVFKPLDDEHHSAQMWRSDDTHHCVLYRLVRWLFPM